MCNESCESKKIKMNFPVMIFMHKDFASMQMYSIYSFEYANGDIMGMSLLIFIFFSYLIPNVTHKITNTNIFQ